MPEVLHTLTKPGGLRLIPKAGIFQVVFNSGWKGNLPYKATIADDAITVTSVIRAEYNPRQDLANKESSDDWEFDNIRVRMEPVVPGVALATFLSPKAPVVGQKTFTYYVYEP